MTKCLYLPRGFFLRDTGKHAPEMLNIRQSTDKTVDYAET